jgi:hypothetical protein
MKKRPRRRKNSKAISRIAELLREKVIDSFGWYGIAEPVEESSQKVVNGEQGVTDDDESGEPDEDEFDEEEYEERQYYYDPSDVQGALFEAISTAIDEELIPGYEDPKHAPSLAEVFEVLLGRDSELREKAEYFEELISGYDDRAHIDDLREAYSVLVHIVDQLAPTKK